MAISAGENLAYVKDLIKRYEDFLSVVQKAEDPAEVTKQERLVQPVLKELQLAIPRIWDDFVRETRDRREQIRNGE